MLQNLADQTKILCSSVIRNHPAPKQLHVSAMKCGPDASSGSHIFTQPLPTTFSYTFLKSNTKMYENPEKCNITSADIQQQDILQKYS